jgi:DEAD/DEAH box helicase domain-containing protein
LNQVIDSLKRDKVFMANVSHWEVIPARKGDYRDIPESIDRRIREALASEGISRLYTHQHDCYQHINSGENVVVVTPTASGKTLSYNLPVLQWLLNHPESKAMYLFPTKALSQDQQSELNELDLTGRLGVKIFTYDGDTPGSIRISARNQGQIVITNPDMLHSGILPNHPKWIKFFQSLKFIVIDELHMYRGVFGSHLTNLIRRLKRITVFYGSKVQFICCSATIGNPLELAEKIIEEKAVLIDKNGSPSGKRHFILYNPPLLDPVQGIRRGVVLESQAIASKLLKAGIKTIVFARSRVRTELIASYIRDSLKNFYTDDHRIRVASYRGGYLPNERRKIEKGLRDGEIHGVVSTSALELGIDIGGLDASILAGFPGSIASTWQRAGRAGRRSMVSLSILVASSSPMDQYIIQHPEYFFGKSPESGWVDPDNIYILMDQLKCAVFELPFSKDDLFKGDVQNLLAYLEENGVIRFTGDKWYWSERSYPAEKVSLRTATAENVVIVNTTGGKNRVIGEMDRPSAKELLHGNAIYIHSGDQYIVKSLDLEEKRCYVEETNVNYYTDTIVKTDIKLLHKDSEESFFHMAVVIGDILVRTQVTRFKKLKFKTHENIGYGDVDLPEEEMHTRSVVVIFQPDKPGGELFQALRETEKGEVIRRLGYLMKHVAPVFLLCDPGDLGIAERLRDPTFGQPCLYIYDNYPGGTGLSEGILRNITNVFKGCLDVIANCPCSEGCPSCMGPPDENNKGDFNAKKTVSRFLSQILTANG